MTRVLVIGAHPDDAEVFAGGTAALWRKRGDEVRFLAFTNGNAGHHRLGPGELALRRHAEARRAAEILGVETEVLDHDDGCLVPDLPRRQDMIRRIRRFRPDLVLTHRPWDYHPDHRYTSTLVADATFLVTVPRICPETTALERNPVVAYLYDGFQRPLPFRPDVAVDTDRVLDRKLDALGAHASQFYEWVPFLEGTEAEVPQGAAERRAWLARRWGPDFALVAKAARSRLVETYGEERGRAVHSAEAFEICEYGSRPDAEGLRKLFPLEV
jgi:LmbE family N-acetylglucosaminyl deacetylase